MITSKDFLSWAEDGCEDVVSSFLLLGVTAARVIGALNVINPCFKVFMGRDYGGNVSFFGASIPAETIYELTRILGCTGYADSQFDGYRTVVAKNGEDYDNYTAEWVPDGHYKEDDSWICELYLIDNETGARFYTGYGYVSDEVNQYYTDIVNNHGGNKVPILTASEYKAMVVRDAQIELKNYEVRLFSMNIETIRTHAEEYGAMVECLNTIVDADKIAESYMSSGAYDLRKMTRYDWKRLSETENVLSKMAKDSYWCKEQYYAGMYDVMKSMCERD